MHLSLIVLRVQAWNRLFLTTKLAVGQKLVNLPEHDAGILDATAKLKSFCVSVALKNGGVKLLSSPTLLHRKTFDKPAASKLSSRKSSAALTQNVWPRIFAV